MIDLRAAGRYAEGWVASFGCGPPSLRRFDCWDDMLIAILRRPLRADSPPRVRPRVDTSDTWSSILVSVACGAFRTAFAVDAFASGFEGEDAAELDRFLAALHGVAGEPWEGHGRI